MLTLNDLINECAPAVSVKRPNYEALAKARELHDLGLDWISQKLRDEVLLAEKMECIVKEKFVVITPEKIQGFLDRKADEYNRTAKGKTQKTLSEAAVTWTDQFDDILTRTEESSLENQVHLFEPSIQGIDENRFAARTRHFLSSGKNLIGAFVWKEVNIRDYKSVPPAKALQALKDARKKEIFDEFTIASVSKVPDPLLLGRLNGSEDRYFLAQWGDDIALDDII